MVFFFNFGFYLYKLKISSKFFLEEELELVNPKTKIYSIVNFCKTHYK